MANTLVETKDQTQWNKKHNSKLGRPESQQKRKNSNQSSPNRPHKAESQVPHGQRGAHPMHSLLGYSSSKTFSLFIRSILSSFENKLQLFGLQIIIIINNNNMVYQKCW